MRQVSKLVPPLHQLLLQEVGGKDLPVLSRPACIDKDWPLTNWDVGVRRLLRVSTQRVRAHECRLAATVIPSTVETVTLGYDDNAFVADVESSFAVQL